MSITTVADFKLHINMPLSNTSEDGRIQQILDGAESAIWNWLGRERAPGYSPFDQVQTTEYYDGKQRQMLVLRRRPVVSVQGVWVDSTGYYGQNPTGFSDPQTAWAIGTQCALMRTDESESNPGILVAFAGVVPSWQGQAVRIPAWPSGMGNIKVTYTAGYSTFPPDLISAICNVAAAVRKAAPRGAALESETLGRYTYSLMKSGGKSGGTVDVDEIGMGLSTLARYKEVNV